MIGSMFATRIGPLKWNVNRDESRLQWSIQSLLGPESFHPISSMQLDSVRCDESIAVGLGKHIHTNVFLSSYQ
ncbi:hypothetical protein RDWZM_000592, partial [Blomia tropicalis]